MACRLGFRMLNRGQTHVDTHSHGTATHAAPELLRTNTLSPAADVFAFAIIGGCGAEGLEGLGRGPSEDPG